ncbi:hypothetical protein I317_01578 [Kwoniella heveanensis CBS 569]|nr:hypothetical protein I317_01578 [Kwoniella heveanensis CBS 569]
MQMAPKKTITSKAALTRQTKDASNTSGVPDKGQNNASASASASASAEPGPSNPNSTVFSHKHNTRNTSKRRKEIEDTLNQSGGAGVQESGRGIHPRAGRSAVEDPNAMVTPPSALVNRDASGTPPPWAENSNSRSFMGLPTPISRPIRTEQNNPPEVPRLVLRPSQIVKQTGENEEGEEYDNGGDVVLADKRIMPKRSGNIQDISRRGHDNDNVSPYVEDDPEADKERAGSGDISFVGEPQAPIPIPTTDLPSHSVKGKGKGKGKGKNKDSPKNGNTAALKLSYEDLPVSYTTSADLESEASTRKRLVKSRIPLDEDFPPHIEVDADDNVVRHLGIEGYTILPWRHNAPGALQVPKENPVEEEADDDMEDLSEEELAKRPTPGQLPANFFKHSSGGHRTWFDGITNLPFPWFHSERLQSLILERVNLGEIIAGHEDIARALQGLAEFHDELTAAAIAHAQHSRLNKSGNQNTVPPTPDATNKVNSDLESDADAAVSRSAGAGSQKRHQSRPDPSVYRQSPSAVTPSSSKRARIHALAEKIVISEERTSKRELKREPFVHYMQKRYYRMPFLSPAISKTGAFHRGKLPKEHYRSLPGEEEMLTDEEVFASPTAEFGRDERTIPPWVVKYLSKWMKSVRTIMAEEFYALLRETGQSAANMAYKDRQLTGEDEQEKKENRPKLPPFDPNLSKRWAERVFGDWMITTSEKGSSWAQRFPTRSSHDPANQPQESRGIIDDYGDQGAERQRERRYAEACQKAARQFTEPLRRAEETRLIRLQDQDEAFAKRWRDTFTTYVKPGGQEFPADFVLTHAPDFLSDMKKYSTYTKLLPEWVTGLATRFLRRARQLSSVKSSEIGSAFDRSDLGRMIFEYEIDREEKEAAVREARQAGYIYQDDVHSVEENEEFGGRNYDLYEENQDDYGVEGISDLDGADCVIALGLESLQPPERWRLAQSTSKEIAHAFQTDDDGEPVFDDNGDYIWTDPEAHLARTLINWPYLPEYDPEPFDAVLYSERLVEGNTTPTLDTHKRLTCKIHQAVAVLSILCKGYARGTRFPVFYSTLLADEVGLGKTWVPLMLMAILRWHDEKRQENPDYLPPCMQPWKLALDPNGQALAGPGLTA